MKLKGDYKLLLLISEIIYDIDICNKYIRIVDLLLVGWKMVNEYKVSDIVDDLEDEKKICSVENCVFRSVK